MYIEPFVPDIRELWAMCVENIFCVQSGPKSAQHIARRWATTLEYYGACACGDWIMSLDKLKSYTVSSRFWVNVWELVVDASEWLIVGKMYIFDFATWHIWPQVYDHTTRWPPGYTAGQPNALKLNNYPFNRILSTKNRLNLTFTPLHRRRTHGGVR